MNIFNIDFLAWKQYIVYSIVIGIVYSFSFGIISVWNFEFMIINALTSSVVLMICSIALWNIFTYGMSGVMNYFQRISILSLYAIISIAIVLGSEFIICVITKFPINLELRMLPSKILIFSLLFCVLRLSFYKEKESTNYTDNSNDDSVDDIENTIIKEDLETKVFDHLSFKTGNRIKMVQIEDLMFLKADDDYVSFYTAEGHWLKKGTMKEFEVSLPNDKFIRVHRSYIVNIDKIAKIECYGQKHLLQLNNNTNIWISISGYKNLRKALDL